MRSQCPSLVRFIAFLVLLTCGSLAPSASAADSFPDDWFFSGAERPKALRDLEGQAAPELTTQAWIGDATKIADARGKVVVLDFWATWCGPCMAAIPENVELVGKYKGKGLVFVGVHDVNSGWDKAPGVVQAKNINYPVAQDTGESAKKFGLSFWPTYVVIDKKGAIRGAGLLPNKVKDAVELLMAEAGEPVSGGAASGNPPEWYLGGATRPAWLVQMEGKPVTTFEGPNWFGKAVTDADRKGRVVVAQFLSPESDIALRQLDQLVVLNQEFGAQGVVFMGVCDARADWVKASATFEARKINVPIVQDAKAPSPRAAIDAKTKTFAAGATATALGLRASPVTLVIDRTGTIRAAGVRGDKVKTIVGRLLAEPMPESSPLTNEPRPASVPGN